MSMRAEQRYPLPAEERALLLKMLLESDALFLALGWMLAVCTAFLNGAAPVDALLFGWAERLGASMKPHPAMLAAPFALVALAQGAHVLLWPWSASFRAAVLAVRQGVNGELMRLGMPQTVACMCAAGLAEEYAFRYGLLGLLAALLAFALPENIAQATALVGSSVLFAAIHGQYRDPWTLGTVFVVGLVLGALFLWTGSLLCAWCAHALYNIMDMLVERHRIVTDDDYFCGNVPCNVLGEMLGKQ